MPVQKRGCFFAALGMLFGLIVLPGPAFAGILPRPSPPVTQEGTSPPPRAEAVSGLWGTSYLLPACEEENEIIPVDP